MAKPTLSDEIEIYNALSKVALKAFEEASLKFVVALNGLGKDLGAAGVRPAGMVAAFSTGANLTANEASVLQTYGKEDLVRSWKKVIQTVDLSLEFRPRVDRPAQANTYLLVPGDTVTIPGSGVDAMATHEIEIDLGIIRYKGIW